MNAWDPRVMVITDAMLAKPRSVCDVVDAALRGGAGIIQLRDKHASARALADQARELLPLVRAHSAKLIINDRLDVALAVGADGVHLGPDDLPIVAARRVTGPSFILGFSTDDPAHAALAESDGADYIGCGAVFGTSSKDVGGERIGTARLDQVARSVSIPVVGIGGIGMENVAEIVATAASGVAVIGAVMAAHDPEAATRALLSAFALRLG